MHPPQQSIKQGVTEIPTAPRGGFMSATAEFIFMGQQFVNKYWLKIKRTKKSGFITSSRFLKISANKQNNSRT
jgi:hypothetical protein